MSLTSEQIIHLHKNPIKANTSFGKKIFIPENEESELSEVNKSIESLKKVLSAERVERRNVRLKAEWLPGLKRAKVTKKIGNISNFGYEEDGNLYLLPEEALFLLEMNRLELTFNGLQFSVQQGYDELLDNNSCSIKQYRIYQNLASQGYHIKNYQQDSRKKERSKRIKLNNENQSEDNNLSEEGNRNLKEHENELRDICYNIYSHDFSSGNKLNHKLKLQSKNDELQAENISTSENSVLTSFSGVDSVAFYQLQVINFDQ